MAFFKKNQADIDAFCRLSSLTGARADYVQGGGGNTSVKFADGLMAIKASGFCLKDITPTTAYAVINGRAVRDFFLTTDMQTLADVEKAGSELVKANVVSIDGLETLRPSVETGFHSILDRFVAHTHSLYVNLAGCAKECEAIFKEALACADYTYALVDYADPGTRLTFNIRTAIDEVVQMTGRRPAVLILKNHGLIVHHDSVEACLQIQEDVNRREASFFGLTTDCFPSIDFEQNMENGLLELDCPFLKQSLLTGKYDRRYYLEEALYPDQIVFLNGFLSFGKELPREGQACIDIDTGRVLFNLSEDRSRVIAETLVCVTFVSEMLARRGYTLAGMGMAAKDFIANWESEQYRRAVASKR